MLSVIANSIAELIRPDPIDFNSDVERCRPFARNLILRDHPQASTLDTTKPLRHRAPSVSVPQDEYDSITPPMAPLRHIHNCPHVQPSKARYTHARAMPSCLEICDGPIPEVGRLRWFQSGRQGSPLPVLRRPHSFRLYLRGNRAVPSYYRRPAPPVVSSGHCHFGLPLSGWREGRPRGKGVWYQHRRAHAHNTTIDGRAAAHDAANEIWSALAATVMMAHSLRKAQKGKRNT
jgi:hypothetical protein